MHWFFPLHSGTAFGTGGMVAMCLTGLTPVIFVFTGLWVWLRKRRGEKIGERRRAQRGAPAADLPPNREWSARPARGIESLPHREAS